MARAYLLAWQLAQANWLAFQLAPEYSGWVRLQREGVSHSEEGISVGPLRVEGVPVSPASGNVVGIPGPVASGGGVAKGMTVLVTVGEGTPLAVAFGVAVGGFSGDSGDVAETVTSGCMPCGVGVGVTSGDAGWVAVDVGRPVDVAVLIGVTVSVGSGSEVLVLVAVGANGVRGRRLLSGCKGFGCRCRGCGCRLWSRRWCTSIWCYRRRCDRCRIGRAGRIG